MKRRTILVSTLAAMFALTACSSTFPRGKPLGTIFPAVTGNSLAGKETTLPAAVKGKPALLLLGYKQNAQFDIDRWLVGLTMAKVDVAMIEVPTIKGMIPGMIAGSIDDGMRSGIPSEDWASVVTVYGEDAETLQKFTGNERGNNARVLLLDARGEVVYFHDRGFSPSSLMKLRAEVTSLGARSAAAAPAGR